MEYFFINKFNNIALSSQVPGYSVKGIGLKYEHVNRRHTCFF